MNIKLYILYTVALIHLLYWILLVWTVAYAEYLQSLWLGYSLFYIYIPASIMALIVMIIYYIRYKYNRKSVSGLELGLIIFCFLSILSTIVFFSLSAMLN